MALILFLEHTKNIPIQYLQVYSAYFLEKFSHKYIAWLDLFVS